VKFGILLNNTAPMIAHVCLLIVPAAQASVGGTSGSNSLLWQPKPGITPAILRKVFSTAAAAAASVVPATVVVMTIASVRAPT